MLNRSLTKWLTVLCGGLLIFSLSACQKKYDEDDPAFIKHNPKAANYNVQLGLAYLKQGNNQRAKRKLLIALQQAPKSSLVNDSMAFYLQSTGEFKAAEEYYLRAVHLGRTKGASRNNYGAFLCRQHRSKEAEKYFLLAARDPGYVNSPGAYENAGLCALQMKSTAKAKQYFLKAVAQDPRRDTSMYELSKIYFKERNYIRAQDYITVYQKNTAPNPQVMLLAYRIAKRLGQKANVEKYALQLKTQFPQSKQYKQLKAKRRS